MMALVPQYWTRASHDYVRGARFSLYINIELTERERFSYLKT